MREEDMSNISDGWADTEDKHNPKCPMCGTEGWIIEYPDDNGSGWFCNNKDCSFSCNPEDLPKMVAAMKAVNMVVVLEEALGEEEQHAFNLKQKNRAVVEELATLKKAVAWMLYIDTPENFEGKSHIEARANVEKLLEESK